MTASVRILGAAALILLAGCSQPSVPPEMTAEERLSATEGGQRLLEAINAHGGLDAWHRAETSAYVWEFVDRSRTRLVAHNRTRQIYHDILMWGGTEMAEGAQMAWDGTTAWSYPDSLQTNARFMASTAYYFQSIPFVLADRGVRYEILPDAELDSTMHQVVRVTFDDNVGDAHGDHYTLFLHPESKRVSGLLYRSTYGDGRPRPEINDRMRETLLRYLDYVTVDGLTVPTRFEAYAVVDGVTGRMIYEAAASEISFTETFDESRLAMPEGGREWPAPRSLQPQTAAEAE